MSSKKNYYCKACNYSVDHLGSYKRHLSSKKHINNIYPWKCKCGKIFKHDSSYYRHKKKCEKIKASNSDNIILSYIDKNQEEDDEEILLKPGEYQASIPIKKAYPEFNFAEDDPEFRLKVLAWVASLNEAQRTEMLANRK